MISLALGGLGFPEVFVILLVPAAYVFILWKFYNLADRKGTGGDQASAARRKNACWLRRLMDARIAWQSVAALEGSDMSDPYCEPIILMGPPMVGSPRNASFLERNPP